MPMSKKHYKALAKLVGELIADLEHGKGHVTLPVEEFLQGFDRFAKKDNPAFSSETFSEVLATAYSNQVDLYNAGSIIVERICFTPKL